MGKSFRKRKIKTKIKTRKKSYKSVKKSYKGGNSRNLDITTITQEQIAETKAYLSSRRENWLVLYAKFGSVNEQLRFSDERWVFFDSMGSEGERLSFVGDINEENIHWLAKNFGESFDYITTDWGLNIDISDPNRISMDFINLLRKGGKVVIPMIKKIVDYWEDFMAHPEDDDDTTIYIASNISLVPFEAGGTGGNYSNGFFVITDFLSSRKKLNIITESKYPKLYKTLITIYGSDTVHQCFFGLSLRINAECKKYLDNINTLNPIKFEELTDEIIAIKTEIVKSWKLNQIEDYVDEKKYIVMKKFLVNREEDAKI